MTLPKALANGVHHLVASGVDVDGNARNLVVEVTVCGGAAVLANTGFSAAPSSAPARWRSWPVAGSWSPPVVASRLTRTCTTRSELRPRPAPRDGAGARRGPAGAWRPDRLA